MIPVLYSANATDFSSFGLGVLTDTVSCEVTEERNGVFECLLKYPVSGQHYGLITKECIVKANAYISANPLGATSPTMTVSFEPLWKQPEYSDLLERVNLCDTVTIRHSALGVSVSAMVIQTVYDTLAERYTSISLGQSRSSMSTTVSEVPSSA